MMVSYVQEYMHEITLVHPHSRIVLVLARFISGVTILYFIYSAPNRVHFALWHKLVYNFKITSSVFKKVDRNIP